LLATRQQGLRRRIDPWSRSALPDPSKPLRLTRSELDRVPFVTYLDVENNGCLQRG
jgi:hypothetical protein